jgi:hypothetical protein
MQERNRVGYVGRLGYRYPFLTPKTWPIIGSRFIEAEQLGGADPIWALKFCVLLLDKATKCYLHGESFPYFSFSSRCLLAS